MIASVWNYCAPQNNKGITFTDHVHGQTKARYTQPVFTAREHGRHF